MTVPGNVRWLEGDEPLVARLANWIAETHTANLPDLSQCVVLVPEVSAAGRLRECLLDATRAGAVLGPQVTTLRQWVEAQTPTHLSVLNTHGRELMLVEVLRDHPALLGGGDPWQIADELLDLFEELSFSQDAEQRLLDPAFFTTRDALSPFETQADLVRTLWRAWNTQLEAEGRIDRATLYARGLAAQPHGDEPWRYFLAGYDWLSAAELAWVQKRLAAGQLRVLIDRDAPLARQLMPSAPLPNPASAARAAHLRLLDSVFKREAGDLRARAADWTGQASPLRDRCAVFAAASPEQEARVVDIQARLWLLEGCRSVAIVTEDRRLARRVSALLRRAGLDAQDDAGWPLSTTMAAGALERWLEAVESDFAHQPLIDVLKSGFLQPHPATERTVLELQTGIIEHAGVARGLAAYREAVAERARALWESGERYAAPLLELLDHVAQAAEPLLPFVAAAAIAPVAFIDSLTESLRRLGLWGGYTLDPAGQRILQELAEMRLGLDGRTLTLAWSECRAWLGRALETHNFRPARADSPVRIINLAQSRLIDDDGVILAGADDGHLPGQPGRHALFNQNVRHELGLPTWRLARERRLREFTRLLATAPRLLCTYTTEVNGNPQLPSPWVALLMTIHQQAFATGLENAVLAALVRDEATRVRSPAPAPLPSLTEQPRPVLPRDLLPSTLSASGHQRLLDCPYRFYAADGLRLKARERIAETLDKRDFGVLVHEALQAFHFGKRGIAEHFPHPIDASTRQTAIERLTEVSRRVFGRAIDAAYQHRAWWQIWQALIPRYIDWQIGRQADWIPAEGEQEPTRELGNGFTLQGRFDRLDCGPAGVALIDYKTGHVPEEKEILAGEAVQLTTYALLVADVVETTYVNLADPEEPLKATALRGDDLRRLVSHVEARLRTLLDALTQGAPLPANGDTSTCRYCDFSGLCRRETWNDAPA